MQDGVGRRDANRTRDLCRRFLDGRASGLERHLHPLAMLGQLGGQLRGEVAGPSSLEQRASQAALDALQRAEHGGGIGAEALPSCGEGPTAHQRERHLQIARGQSELRPCNHFLQCCLFIFLPRNHRVLMSATNL